MTHQHSDIAPLGYPDASEKGLKSGALGLLSSVVVGTASTAPAYSLAASLGFVVASGGALLAGVKAPAIMILAFIPMYFIAIAYQELNKAEPDCGTTFTWATRTFGPTIGWLGGWGIIAADVIVMANLAQVAGSYTFTLFGLTDLGSNVWASTAAGLAWIAIMTWICYRGIEVSARLQYVLLSVEVIVLVLVAVVALVRVYGGTAMEYSLIPQWDWLWPGGLGFGDVIAPALLTAFFIYWGWDTALSCNEESEDPGSTPGRAAVISTVLLLGTYAIVTIAAVAFAGVGTDGIGLGNPDNAVDVFNAIGPALFGDSPIGKVGMVLLAASILTSASASTQTTILPTARTALSMGVYKALPKSFAKVHPKYLTPSVATIAMGVVSAVFYLAFTALGIQMLAAVIGSIGLMIAFYYGLTGFACTWFYRKSIFSDVRSFFMRGLIPLAGGITMLATFFYGLQQFLAPDWLQDENGEDITLFGYGAVGVTGLLAMLIGLVLMFVWWAVDEDFFNGRTLPMRAGHDLVLAGPHVNPEGGVALPDSGLPEIVIAPDLSNLPQDAAVVDLATGKVVHEASEHEGD
jgi:amino acid transporter